MVEGVVAGAASASYTLPKTTAGGIYTIQAVYTDPDDFSTSTDTKQLTVSAAATNIAVSGGTTPFNEISGEGLALSATVSSLAGTTNEGSVTFTVLNASGTQVAGPFVMSVLSGAAGGNVFLSADTAVGSYVIHAVYNGTASYAASLPSTANLSVTAAGTTTAAVATALLYNSASQVVPLSASVISPAGAVGEGMITFTILSGATQVGLPATASVSSGYASANYTLPPGTPIGTYTIQAVYTDTGDNFIGSSDLTHDLTITQPPAAKLFLFTPPSSTATAGTPFTTQPVIYEEDQFGNLETGDNSTMITVSLASGSGPLTGTLTATVSGGIATFTNLGDDTDETVSLRFTSGNLTAATSAGIVVSPAAASKLVVTQQPSPTATAGVFFATQPVVKEEDQFGNVITSDSTNTVTVARGSLGTAALQGTNLTVTLSSGVATFSGLSYDKAESMNLGFTTNANGVSAASSNTIAVSPAAINQLVINQQPSASASTGQPFATQPVIYEEDQFNNLESGDNTTVIAATLFGGAGPLQGTTTATVSGGVARFSNLGDNTAETISLDFTTGSLASPLSNSIVVSPGPAAKLVIHTEPSSNATAGHAFTIQPVIYHRGLIRQSGDRRQLLGGDGLAQQRHRAARRHGHGQGCRWNRHVHQPG